MIATTASLNPSVVPICQHCNKRRANRARQLCWTCYYAPGIRERYPYKPLAVLVKGTAQGNFYPPPPPWPTEHLPGTPEKIEVMRWRALHGFAIWHRKDATFESARAVEPDVLLTVTEAGQTVLSFDEDEVQEQGSG